VIVLREVDDRDAAERLEDVPERFESGALSLWKVRVS